MTKQDSVVPELSETGQNHRRVPKQLFLAIGLCLAWFVPVGWIAFDHGLDATFILVLVTVFAAVVLGLLYFLARASRGRLDIRRRFPLGRWLKGQFETYTGRLAAGEALVMILLPLAATATGITLLGLVFDLTR